MVRLSTSVGAFSALALALAACSPAQTPAAEAPAAEQAEAAAAATSVLVSLTGRWGLTQAACAPTNETRDGVIEIGAGTVQVGMDSCAVTDETQEPSEVTRVTVTVDCISGEGETYERPLTFVSSGPDTLTWIDEGGTAEPYARCP
jgi:hypothetical protein